MPTANNFSHLPKCAFYVAPENGEPCGTAFAMSDSDAESDPFFVVTARHVISACKATSSIVDLVLNSVEGGQFRLPVEVDSWQCHQSEDVAVLELDKSELVGTARLIFTYSEYRIGGTFAASYIEPGHEVAAVGLFGESPGVDAVRPVLRFGRIARLNLERHRVHDPFTAISGDFDSYVVELTSTPGMSGAPVFLDSNIPCLVGVLLGHWDAIDDGIHTNVGLSLVTPATRVEELLEPLRNQD